MKTKKTGPKPKDYCGKKVSGILIVKFHSSNKLRRFWRCKCHCGKAFVARMDQLLDGHTQSCGCVLKAWQATGKAHFIHGLRHTLEYNTWAGMIQRCTNPNNPSFHKYGERGIKVCKRWIHSFQNFFADMGAKPNSQYSIDRKNNNGNYEPSNCHWADKKHQANNRRLPRVSRTGRILRSA